MVICRLFTTLFATVLFFNAGCSNPDDKNYWATKYYTVSINSAPALGQNSNKTSVPAKQPETLDELLGIALENSPELRSAFYRWRASQSAISATKSLPDPRISYTYFIESVQTRVGAQNQSLMLSQKLPLWTKIGYNTDIATAAAAAELAKLTQARLKLTSEIKTLWAKLFSLNKALETNRQILQILVNSQEVLESRYASSKISKHEILDIQMRIDMLEDQIITLQDNLHSTRQQLNAASGRNINAPLPTPQQLSTTAPEIEQDSFTNRVMTDSPELQRIEAKLSASRTKISSAKAQYIPDVTISGGWVDTKRIGGTMSPTDNGLDPITIGVSLNLPVWVNRINADIRKARSESLAIAAEKNSVKLKLQSEAANVIYNYNQARRKISLYQNSLIPKIHESFKIAQSDFASGQISYQQLLDTLETFLEFKLNYHNAIAQLNIARARLEYLQGSELQSK